MSLLSEIVAAALRGDHLGFEVSDWEGSFNGHPHSVTVESGRLSIRGIRLVATFAFTVAEGFPGAGAHGLAGELMLPHGAFAVALDGIPQPAGRLVLLPKLKGVQPRVEVLFFCPTDDDPLQHYRFDGSLKRKGA